MATPTNPNPSKAPQPPLTGTISLSKDSSSPQVPLAATTPPVTSPAPNNTLNPSSAPSSPSKPLPPRLEPPSTPPPPTPPPSTSKPVKKSPFSLVAPILIVVAIGLLIILLVMFVRSRFNRSVPLDGESTLNTESVSLTYWGLWEPSAVMQQIIDQFESTNPNIKINYQQQSYRDYRERLQTALDQKSGPQIFRYHHTWVPMLGNLLDTAPVNVMSPEEFQTIYYPIMSQSLVSPKGVVGIPLMIDGLGLYYNVDILQAANISPPTTWDEFRIAARQLTLTDPQTKAIIRSGAALGTTSNVDHWSDILGLLMLQNSANLSLPNSTLGQDALTFYTLFARTNPVWSDTFPNSTAAFANQTTAMIIAPSWRAHDINNLNPNLNFRIVPVPQVPDNQVTWASFWAEGVSATASKAERQAAWQFLKYLSDKETMRTFYQVATSAPGRLFGEPFSRQDLSDQLRSDPLVGAYITQAPTAQSWYLSSATWDNGLNDDIIEYYQDAINSVLGGTSPDEALAITEQGIAQVLSRYNLR